MKDKLATLKQTMESPNVDDNDKREYFITLLQSSVLQALDEIASLEAEKPILEYMEKHSTGIYLVLYMTLRVFFGFCRST